MKPLASRLPPRDTLYLVTAAVTQWFLALDAYLSHMTSGTIRGAEWVPVWFGVIAGLWLLIAGAVSLARPTIAVGMAAPAYLASVAVGAVGAYLHWRRLVVPNLPIISGLVGEPFVWVPPVLAPLAFALVGVLGLSALFREEPIESGRLRLGSRVLVTMPLSKARAYLLLVTTGIVLAVVSATLDHAHGGLEDPWMWVAIAAGVFSATALLAYALEPAPLAESYWSALVGLVALAATGLLGELLHLRADLALAYGSLVVEKLVRGAPPLAPLLYVYMATLGVIAMWPPPATAR